MIGTAATRPSVGSIVGGRFRLIERIGEGGAGEVFSAVHLVTGRRLAVKLLSARLCRRPRAIERFRREARAASRAESDGVVQVFDFAEHDGNYFLVMELLEGHSLDRWLTSEGSLCPRMAVSLGVQVCRILEVVHSRGIVHRDLKPHNLFLVSVDERDIRVKLLDFGIARLREEDLGVLTETGEFIGTLAYMAPEQTDAKGVDHRADVYSLGVILYQVLTGRLPFSGAPAKMFHDILHEPPPPLGDVPMSPRPRAVLQAIVDRALEKDPARRFQSMAAFAEALESVVDGGDMLARYPVSRRGVLARWRGRLMSALRPGVWVWTGLLVLAGIGGALTTFDLSGPMPPDPNLAISAGPLAPLPAKPGALPKASSSPVEEIPPVVTPRNLPPAAVQVPLEEQLREIVHGARLVNQYIKVSIRIPAGADRPDLCKIIGAVGDTREGRKLARKICRAIHLAPQPTDRTLQRVVTLGS